jgi:thioredoxin-related protein
MSEKEFARFLKVQFTPTLLFLDTDGRIVTRLNGYYPPNRFSAALDYVIERKDGQLPLAQYLSASAKEAASERLHEQAFFMKPPYELRRKRGGKPLAVIFETRHCQPCDEMHDDAFRRADIRAQLAKFDVARFALSDPSQIVSPAGGRLAADAWARELNIAYTPAIVFFDDTNREVFRIDGYMRPFHLATSLEYVASGAYRSEPEFQRFIRAKAERQRAQGKQVDLWR